MINKKAIASLKDGKSIVLSDYVPSAICSMLLACFTVVATKVSFSGSVLGNAFQNKIDSFTIVDTLLFVVLSVLYFGVLLLAKIYHKRLACLFTRDTDYKLSLNIIWILSSCIVLTAWLIYFIAFCPGSVLGDSFSSLSQAFSNSYDNHHPVLYSFMVGVFAKIGLKFGNINFGIFAYSVFQGCALSVTIGYIIRFMSELHIRIWLLIATLVYFCVMPFFPTYAIIMWKDPLFSCSLAWLSIILARFALDNTSLNSKKLLIALGIASALTMFLRNNGVFIVPVTAIILLIVFRKQAKKALFVMGSIVALALIIQGPVYNALNISKPAVEAFGIPIQQIAYVITENPESLSTEQKEIANNLLPYDKWKSCYRPCLVDTIKWAEGFDTNYLQTHRRLVMQLWLELALDHPESYFKAFALATLGFWHPYLQNSYGYVDTYILENEYGIHYTNLLGAEETESLRNILTNFRPMIGSGIFVWLMLTGLALTWLLRRRDFILLYLPSFLCWVTILVATPVAFSLRYVYILTLLAPLYLVIPFLRDIPAQIQSKKSANNTSKLSSASSSASI